MTTLKKLRQMTGLTQKKCAELAGINPRLWQKYENGEYSINNMSVETYRKMSAVIGCPIDDLENIDLDVLTSDCRDAVKDGDLTMPDVVGMAKLSAVQRLSKIGRFGDTFSANFKYIPESVFEKLTVLELAVLVDSIYAAYSNGKKDA